MRVCTVFMNEEKTTPINFVSRLALDESTGDSGGCSISPVVLTNGGN